jgi:hypothetical protein
MQQLVLPTVAYLTTHTGSNPWFASCVTSAELVMNRSSRYTRTPGGRVSVLALNGLPLMYVKLLSTRSDQSCCSLLRWPAAAGVAPANWPTALRLPPGAPAAAAVVAAVWAGRASRVLARHRSRNTHVHSTRAQPCDTVLADQPTDGKQWRSPRILLRDTNKVTHPNTG